ncbi:hypothetical protein H2200_003264 [Cladophialophora chaetospira]|uniref:FAM50A/XAP5 C-terminal domain-containing protein n=1 Tax=Cladophialophora chaetospira TaxID=386627 RepID=A0AA38XH41_9EURO|nr:hypothetical protein H2200_003264 [Cladophialophora chaetospira]
MASSNPPSGASTPRFTTQTATAEDLLKSQTVGLVNLADFRKRRADVLELKDKEAIEGASTPDSDGAVTSRAAREGRPKKKFKKKTPGKGLLSFGGDDDDTEDGGSAISTPAVRSSRTSAEPSPEPSADIRRKLTPNPNSSLPVPRALTKAALAAEAQEREKLRKEFLEIQERVKETEIEMPFVFYDAGANVPGGSVKVKKGDHIWLFLERCRKVGAELGVSGADPSGLSAQKKSREDARKQWARVGVDDLMLVKGEVIVPHHYEFYYFIANKIPDPSQEGRLLFGYSGTADVKNISGNGGVEPLSPLRVPGQKKEEVEGHNDDPTLTKVVDRRWYEKNKHIYPASVWKEFKAGKEFEETTKGGRRDAQGNAHVFCPQCAEKTGLTRTPQEQRRCPTCKSDLPNPHDVVSNLLDPPDDYKASVLAGLDPATIIECAQKALSFWTYQNTQEHGYQQYVAKHLTQRCQQLKAEADKIVHEANTRIEALEGQIHELSTDRQSMEQKYAEVCRQYQEKSRKQQQTQKLYDAIKQKVQVEKMGPIANNDVDNTLQSIHATMQPERTHHDLDLRQDFRSAERQSMAGRMIPRYAPVQVEPERLHPQQRSGSSVAGSHSDHMRMPPPGGLRNPRIANLATSATPMQRAELPVGARLSVNRSQIPTTASRSHLAAGPPLPGSSRRQQIQQVKMPGSAQNYGAISSGMKVGRAGATGSLDMSQSYDQYGGRPFAQMTRPATKRLTLPQFRLGGKLPTCSDSSAADIMQKDAGTLKRRSPQESDTSMGKVMKSKSQTTIKHPTIDIQKLGIIFKNPILLSSFVRNFERKDYAMLAQIAASIPGVSPWPQWDPLTQPSPQGQLPFEIKDLPVQCQGGRNFFRRLAPKGPAHAGLCECEWERPDIGTIDLWCQISEKAQGIRPKPGPNHEKALERSPIELLECVGYTLKLTAFRSFDAAACLKQLLPRQKEAVAVHMASALKILEKGTSYPSPVLSDIHGCHGPGHMICFTCARQGHLSANICLWHHERMIPLCRDCSMCPPAELSEARVMASQSSVEENIRSFNTGKNHLECDCYLAFSPDRGYHLCNVCASGLYALVHTQYRFNRRKIYPQHVPTKIREHGSPYEHLGRNHCLCGKSWQNIVDSWEEFSQDERDKRMFRMCLFCTGHIPRNKIITAKPTNCL